ncbi:hypothetical protein [Bifidobacterium scaligerum]|uniref:Uncharacterized protein n=1 Tax=Bifidobacterium scaligerum TaxID=2052656 RepID=A0A2M9HTQ1_9BIFI|nr:hypothetical protein [Bifidobacterium scaligerum]PJM80193.1 hypothetical protein CUU80_02945 [Bifidobacterium scaligerum]
MKKFFQGLSLSSIVAGTLAAVTSFLLAAHIGIAGSVIGAAASYIISSVATNIYKNVITASTEKFQSVSNDDEHDSSDDEDASPTPTDRPREEHDSVSSADAGNTHEEGRQVTSSSDTAESDDIDARAALAVESLSVRKPREIVSNRTQGHTYSVNELRKKRKPRNTTRTAVIVTLVSGLLAVALTAGIIMLVTRGQGTDHVVRDWSTPTVTTPTQTDTDTQTVTPNSSSDDLNQSGNSASQDSTSGNTGSTGSDSSTSSDTNTSNDSSTSTGNSDSSGTTDTNSGTNSGSTSNKTESSSGSSDSSSDSSTDSETNSSTSGGTGSTGGSNSSGSSSSTGSSNGSSSSSGTSSNTGEASGTGVTTIH